MAGRHPSFDAQTRMVEHLAAALEPRAPRGLARMLPGPRRGAGPELLAALREGHDALGEAVLVVDRATRRILYASAGTRGVLGREPEELLREDWMALVGAADRETVAERARLRVAGHRVHAQSRIRTAAGGEVDVATVPLELGGSDLALTLVRCAPARPVAAAAPEPVTGLPGRPFLLERVAGALAGGAWAGLPCVGLDRVGLVNDALGHAAGDELLAAAGRRLHATVRAGDVVARLAGDEFAILCEDLDAPALDALAERVRTALGAPLVLRGTELHPSAVVGITAGNGPRRDPEGLLREATAAMHGAKLTGRAVAHHQPGTRDGAERALRTEAELHHALDRGELVLHYQPQLDLASGRAVRGVEALVRWQHPERGLIGPDAFIATAEDTGLIRRLGAWVLDEACGRLAAWRAAGLADELTLSVNVSPRELEDETLVERVAATLAARGIEPDALVLEITESAVLDAGGAAFGRLRALEELGVGIAVDDFGCGWSSLANLAQVPVSILKLDRRFVARMAADEAARAIVSLVCGLGHAMGLAVVAEGIEEEAQAIALAELGAGLGQGHLFAPASAPADLEALLRAGAPAAPAAVIRAFLCDDAPALRELLRATLEVEGDVEVVGEAGDGEGLPAAVAAARADVVLLDLSMPRVDGLEALADLRAADPGVGIVVLSGFDPERMEAKALALGADRYLEKAAGMGEVRAAVRAVHALRRGAVLETA